MGYNGFMCENYKNGSEAQGMVRYALSYSYHELMKDMLDAIVENSCIPKADAHLALCIKFALENGCDKWEAHNCYRKDTKDESDYSDFYLFRDHTRLVTDYLDEQLGWDMRSVTNELVDRAVDLFKARALTYKFRLPKAPN
jgi:hypothetical protein